MQDEQHAGQRACKGGGSLERTHKRGHEQDSLLLYMFFLIPYTNIKY